MRGIITGLYLLGWAMLLFWVKTHWHALDSDASHKHVVAVLLLVVYPLPPALLWAKFKDPVIIVSTSFACFMFFQQMLLFAKF